MRFEVWDFESGNCLASYESEAMALDLVRELPADDRACSTRALSLVRGHLGDADAEVIVDGPALAARAEAAASAQRKAP